MSLTNVWSLIVVLVATAVAPRGAFAQAGATSVTCLSSFDWMNNSLGQNPCLVGSYLVSECLNQTLGIGPFIGSPYTGPTLDTANDCLCSTVTYSMFAACGTCQNTTVESWSVWSFNCSTSLKHYSVYPLNIPNGTAVPQWAYLDVTNDMFNATAAQQDGDSPESTSTQVQSTTSIISSTTSVSASLTSSTIGATTQSLTSNVKSSSVEAIAGGVVGGVIAGIAIAGIVAWLFVRRRRSTKARALSAVFSDSSVGPSVYMTRELRLYDPSNPSTFPASPPSGAIPTTVDNVYQKPSIPSHVYSNSTGAVQYSGVPEL
ncbi:hypothetical protein K503DRAFT_774301 [Rhizopogon vinicolor AM-OR11-026]|uniref:Mid2 domain-containing protein n=1 Tax=Rhizopogon vinicolor AM-OR11-026 TaxID=1314800 RepID=A0A1B7MPZ3_9AGAM|nr:hypothetical protein K503DRAFT_774301 [Rhizopogon vinicolor AM-OR11-026]